MQTTREFFKHHRLSISETKSKVMSYDAASCKTTFKGTALLCDLTLDQVLNFKYLGVPLGCAPYSLFRGFNDQVKRRARSYLSSVLSLVRSGPDRAALAFSLWTQVALPSILYGADIIPLDDATIKEVEKCQSRVGKFILNIPTSSANICSNIDAGLKPVWAVIAEKVLLYARSTMSRLSVFWPKIAMDENMEAGSRSLYFRYLLKWKQATDSFDLDATQIRKSVRKAAILDVVSKQKLTSTSTFAMCFPRASPSSQWFRPRAWVSDSGLSQVLSQFRSCNAGLGNRGPAKDGMRYKLCPLCDRVGEKALNNEVIVKLQSQVQTSVLGLGVEFVLPLSQQEQQQEEPPTKFNWSVTLKTKSCFPFFPQKWKS